MNYIRITAYDKDGTVVGVRTIAEAEINCTYFLDDLTGPPAAVSVVVRDVDEEGFAKPRTVTDGTDPANPLDWKPGDTEMKGFDPAWKVET